MGDVLTITQVARALKVSRVRVFQFIKAKRLQASRVGHMWVVHRSHLGMFKEQRRLEAERREARASLKQGGTK